MSTARTHKFNVRSGGVARPVEATPKPDDFTPVSAESFGEVDAFDPSTLDFDPADHTVDEVKAFVEANPETADAVLELELNGKERSGLLTFLENFTPDSED